MAKAGRKRKYVRVEYDDQGRPSRVGKGGTEIEGLSFDASVESYYTRQGSKKKHLGRDLAVAIARLRGEEPVAVSVNLPPIILQNNDHFVPNMMMLAEAARALVLANGEERQKMIDAAAAFPSVPAKQVLSDCAEAWREFKVEQDRTGNYVDETIRIFKEFVSVVGDKPLNFLDQEDFEAFERHLNRTYDKRNDWYVRRLKGIRAVFNHVSRKKRKWPLPAGWKTWFDAIERQTVVPSRTNKKKLPQELLKAMLAVCEKHAAIDVGAMPKESQADKARRNRALERKRSGVQLNTILHLAVQTGFGPEDICKLRWSNIILDAELPNVNLPRTKSKWKTGVAVPRRIPLLPATVQALQAWRHYEKPNEYVFRSAKRGPWVYDKLSRAFRNIRLASDYVEKEPDCWLDGDQKKGDIWSFKHLRNIPGNVAQEAGLEEWIAGAVLGHVPSTLVGKRYTDDSKPEMLLPLIEAIGSRYL